jgi:Tfp pilus assembly protein PilZ
MSENGIHNFRVLFSLGKIEAYMHRNVLYKVYLKLLTNTGMLFDFNTRQYSVGFEVVAVSIMGDPGPHGFQRKSSGDYR